MPTKAAVLTREQEVNAFVMMGSGDTKAREMFVSVNQPLVASIAAKRTGKGLSWEELLSAGNVGMLEAMKKFDHMRGLKFSTCAVPWIEGAIKRAIKYHAVEARRDKAQYTEQELEALQAEEEKRQSEQEAQHLGDGLEGHCEAVNDESDGEAVTPNEALADGQGSHAGNGAESVPFKDDVPACAYEQQDGRDVRKFYLMQIEEALPRLQDGRLRLVVEMRYGWAPYDREHTLAEIGSHLRITPQRVAVLLQDAIGCLKVLTEGSLIA
jgi:RNA polymerase primary sigma factor